MGIVYFRRQRGLHLCPNHLRLPFEQCLHRSSCNSHLCRNRRIGRQIQGSVVNYSLDIGPPSRAEHLAECRGFSEADGDFHSGGKPRYWASSRWSVVVATV